MPNIKTTSAEERLREDMKQFFAKLGFTLLEIKDNVFREETSTWIFQTYHKDHTVDCSTILYDDARKLFLALREAKLEVLREVEEELAKVEHATFIRSQLLAKLSAIKEEILTPHTVTTREDY